MRKLKLYLKTSVWNFYFADDAPEKKEITLQFFEKVKNDEFDIYISDIIFREFARAPQEKEALLLNLIEKYKPKELEINEEVLELAEKYIKEAAMPERAIDDSRHAAVATVY